MFADASEYRHPIDWDEFVSPLDVQSALIHEGLEPPESVLRARTQTFDRWAELGVNVALPAHAEGTFIGLAMIKEGLREEAEQDPDTEDATAFELAQRFVDELIEEQVVVFSPYIGNDEFAPSEEALVERYASIPHDWEQLKQQMAQSGAFSAHGFLLTPEAIGQQRAGRQEDLHRHNAQAFAVLAITTFLAIETMYAYHDEELLGEWFENNRTAAHALYHESTLAIINVACRFLPMGDLYELMLLGEKGSSN